MASVRDSIRLVRTRHIRKTGVTLFRQLIVAIVLLFICLYAGNTVVSLRNNQHLVADQMHVHAQDTATSLGLSMTQAAQDKDIATLDTMFNAVSDSGYYQRVYFTDLDGKVLIDRSFPVAIESVPAWFVSLVSLPESEGRAEVTSGWTQLGEVTVVSHPGQAYMKLWQVTTTQLIWFASITLGVCLLAYIALKWLLVPLARVEAQANEICEKRFVVQETIPKTRELGKVVEAMNRMALQLKHIFEEQLDLIGRLQKQSFQDEVTGLSNRADFDNRLMSFANDQEGGTHTGALSILALSDIACVNEYAGRQEGNAILRSIGEQLKQAVSEHPRAVVARRQGPEFSVFVPDVTPQEGEALAEGMFQSMQGISWLHNQKCPLRFHMGYTYSSHLSSGPEMLGEADIALRQAKLGSASRWIKFADVTDGEVPVLGKPLNDWESYLQQVIDNRLVALHFQPIYTVQGKKSLVAHEVFVRFLHGADLLAAGVVIPIAERLGLMPKLEQLVLESLASTHRQEGIEGKLCVNLSMASIKSPGFMKWLDTFLSSQRKLAAKLVFEVPEYAMKVDDAPLRALCDLLGKRHSSLGIDHFGLGAVAFGYLGSLPLHHLKVHRSFTRELDGNQDNQFYIKSLAGLIHNSGLQLWVEGVESEAEWAQLQPLGVDAAQGYFLGEPQVKPVH
ncbi:MAG: EAL domain-containing protein [Gammaproteobacteria bacterium]|nr:MAG: EAL domain-containing protein [Gammaproteobacteria bacterium]